MWCMRLEALRAGKSGHRSLVNASLKGLPRRNDDQVRMLLDIILLAFKDERDWVLVCHRDEVFAYKWRGDIREVFCCRTT